MWVTFFTTALLIITLDQFVKFLVIKYNFPHFLNKFGPLGLYKKYPFLHSVILTLHFAILIPLFFTPDSRLFFGAGLISAQASNVFDHIIRGGAVDFVPLSPPVVHKKTARSNLADISIAVGLAIYFSVLWKAVQK